MSKTVKVTTKFNNVEMLRVACTRLNLAAPELGRHKLYAGTYEGYGVKLPQWNYPIVINDKTRECHYDNYNGRWGNIAELDKLQQAYAVECIKHEVALAGDRMVNEQVMENGNLVLEIEV